jgi:hypothetical protein
MGQSVYILVLSNALDRWPYLVVHSCVWTLDMTIDPEHSSSQGSYRALWQEEWVIFSETLL